jgi:hypothetical protein
VIPTGLRDPTKPKHISLLKSKELLPATSGASNLPWDFSVEESFTKDTMATLVQIRANQLSLLAHAIEEHSQSGAKAVHPLLHG